MNDMSNDDHETGVPVIIDNDGKPSLPAKRNEADKFRLFRELIEAADGVRQRFDNLADIHDALSRNRTPGNDLPHPGYYEFHELHANRLATARSLQQLLDPDDWYIGDGEAVALDRKVIKKRLAIMLGSVLTSGATTPAVFTQQLLNYVADVPYLKYLALESACREIETSEKWSPTIGAFLKVLEAHMEAWELRIYAMDDTERLSKQVAKLVEKLRPVVAAEKAEAEVMKLKAEAAEAERRHIMACGECARLRVVLKRAQDDAAKAAAEVQRLSILLIKEQEAVELRFDNWIAAKLRAAP